MYQRISDTIAAGKGLITTTTVVNIDLGVTGIAVVSDVEVGTNYVLLEATTDPTHLQRVDAAAMVIALTGRNSRPVKFVVQVDDTLWSVTDVVVNSEGILFTGDKTLYGRVKRRLQH